MFSQKSYTLYNSFYNNLSKIRLNQNRSFLFERSNIFQLSTNTNSVNNNFPFIKSNINPNPNLKRSKSFKKNLDYKFFKLLKKGSLTPNNQKRKFNYPEIIDKCCFNFNLKDEDETIKRIKEINKGNKKHKILSDIALKKEIIKRKKAKQFFNEMKLTKINIRLVKKKVIEEKKIINEFHNMQLKRTKKILKLKRISFDHPRTTKNVSNNSCSTLSLNNLLDKERKLVIKKGRLMHRFHEIMNKIKTNNEG